MIPKKPKTPEDYYCRFGEMVDNLEKTIEQDLKDAKRDLQLVKKIGISGMDFLTELRERPEIRKFWEVDSTDKIEVYAGRFLGTVVSIYLHPALTPIIYRFGHQEVYNPDKYGIVNVSFGTDQLTFYLGEHILESGGLDTFKLKVLEQTEKSLDFLCGEGNASNLSCKKLGFYSLPYIVILHYPEAF